MKLTDIVLMIGDPLSNHNSELQLWKLLAVKNKEYGAKIPATGAIL